MKMLGFPPIFPISVKKIPRLKRIQINIRRSRHNESQNDKAFYVLQITSFSGTSHGMTSIAAPRWINIILRKITKLLLILCD